MEHLKENPIQPKGRGSFDASATWTDPNGNAWTVFVEFGTFDGRVDIAAVLVEPVHSGYSLNRSVLAQLPLRDLFRESLGREQLGFHRWHQMTPVTRNHQGRISSDEELKLVAEVRAAALEAGFPVQWAVAEALGITTGTAGNRIKAARARGFIPPYRREANK